MDIIKVHDREFRLSIPNSQIVHAVKKIAYRMNQDYKSDNPPYLIAILNGSFMFTSDLMKELDFQCFLSFMKICSYVKDQSAGKLNELIGLNENLSGKDVIIIEDIIDTGHTIDWLYEKISQQNPRSLKVATLLLKRKVYKGNLQFDYVGIEIPDNFILGYGLDYDGLGRNFKDIYELSE